MGAATRSLTQVLGDMTIGDSYDLSDLELLERDLWYVETRYVEKERLDVEAMFEGALDIVERQVPEVLFQREPGGKRLHVSVGSYSTILLLEPIDSFVSLNNQLGRVAAVLCALTGVSPGAAVEVVTLKVAALQEASGRCALIALALAGALVMLILVICYHRFYWWPIHPIGYLTAYSSAMRILWFSFFVGWVCNALCMRYGGVVLYKRLRLFFVGLIIGDFLMGGIWAVAGLFSDSSYLVLPD